MSTPQRRATALFNDAWLPGEIQQIRAEVREFAEDVLRPVAHRLNTVPESADAFPRQEFAAMAQAGIYQIPFAADVGGRGLEFPTMATLVTLEELSYFSRGFASALFDGQAILVGKTLDSAPEHIRMKFLPALIRGEFVGSFATSEPDASTDLSVVSMQTAASKVEGGWRITGRKRWITNSIVADWIVVLCRTENSLTMFLADMNSKGIKVCPPDLKMGNHAQLTSDVIFDNVFVPDDAVVGEAGRGLGVALRALAQGRMGIGACGVGMAQFAFDYAADYMCKRKVFGRELATMQHWQYVFADHAASIEMARSLYLKAGYLVDRKEAFETEAAMAKLVGSRLPVDLVRDAIQVCGAYGFVRELSATGDLMPLEAIYRDAKIGEIYEGANEIQKWIIARNIFGRAYTG